MTSWINLGITIPLINQWSSFPSPSIGGSSFRFEFIGNIANINTYALVRSYWANGEISKTVKIYPSNEKLILDLPIPDVFLSQGLTTRNLQVQKRFFRSRAGFRKDSAWAIQLEEYL